MRPKNAQKSIKMGVESTLKQVYSELFSPKNGNIEIAKTKSTEGWSTFYENQK